MELQELIEFLAEHWTDYSVISEGWAILKFEGNDTDFVWLTEAMRQQALKQRAEAGC